MTDASTNRPEGFREPPTQVRTFLVADIRGYTRFTQEKGDEAAAKLVARFALHVREIVQSRGGEVIELRGDEALSVFVSGRQAIRAAVDLQERFLEATLADPQLPLLVGIGIDTGEAVPLEGGFRGGALNLAARLCGQASAGECLATREAVHLARKVDGTRFVDRGDVRLKGLEEPVRIFRIASAEGDVAERLRQLVPEHAPRTATSSIWRLMDEHRVATALTTLGLVVVLLVAGTLLVQRGPPGPGIAGDAVALIDLERATLVGSVPLGSRPGAVAIGDGSVWVALPDRGAVVQIDPKSMAVVDTVPVGADPSGIAVGAGSVWVTNSGTWTVSRISPATHKVEQTIDVPGGPAGIIVDHGGVWVANSVNDSVSRIDPATGDVVVTIAVGDQPGGLAVGEAGLWVANAGSADTTRVDAENDRAVQTVGVGNGPRAIAAGSGAVWVANVLDGTVSRIDPVTNAVVQTMPAGETPTDLAVGGGFVWVSDQSQGSVRRIDPQSGAQTIIRLGAESGDIAMSDTSLWVGVRGPLAAHRGGTLTVMSRNALDTIDPALGYFSESWNILPLTNDGLVGFHRVGGLEGASLVPDLATALPKPVDGGRTYTFQLRPGIRYSNNDDLRPEDFRRAIERVFRLNSDGAFHYLAIDGAEACARTPATCDLSDGIVTDGAAHTVTFHLVKPDPDFLYRLALPFAFAVPVGTPDVAATTSPIPATGPYVIETYTRDASTTAEELVLGRNPAFHEWSAAAKPDGFPDRIVWHLGADDAFQVNEIEAGRADLMYRELPADLFGSIATSHAGQVQIGARTGNYFMSLNPGTPPFNDVRVRRALNLAVDRKVIADIFAGIGRSTCQVLPANLPGYVPYCPFTRDPGRTWSAPDLDQARALVDASGTAGSEVTVWATPDYAFGIPVPVGRYFVDLLDALGYRATLKVIETRKEYFAVTLDPAQHVQIAFSGWSSDYPTESGFIVPVLSCESDNSQFCDPAIDRRIDEAMRLQLTDLEAAHRQWTSIEHDLTDLAPWVTLADRTWVNFVSERLGNFQVNPQWGPLTDQMWVN